MPYQLFLDTILEVSNAQYGFVGEVGTSADGNKLMKIHAVTDFSQNSPAAKKLINKLKDDNFFFRHFDNLFGAAIKTGQVICENNPPTNPHSSNKVIPGHPTISNFLGIPILSGEQVIGLIGLGNKQGGFNGADVEDLKPFATTYSVILNALDNEERNQTLQKDATDKALILSTVGDHSPDTIAVLDAEYEFKFLSPSYKKHFGRSVTEIEAKRKVRALIVKTLGQKYWQADEHYRSRLRITTKELEHRWLETSINIFKKEGRKKIIAFIREVSVQVKSEQSLRASLRKEREFKMFLSDFMNIVAHEFKTPLSTILSSLELSEYYLQSEGEEKLEKVNHHLGKIKREAENLHKIVVSSLTYDRFVKEEVKLKLEELYLNRFIKESLVQYGLTDLVLFKSELPETFKVEWDRFLMQTTLVNLVNNAIKFSPSRQKPIVSLVKTENGLELSVQDFGIGISQKDLPYIFTPFYRAANANDIEGTGMGLIAVKNFVKLHGGHIDVISELGSWSKFTLSFQLKNEVFD
ncbi:GAF domain-containing sensor histidine kinase [Algoriphagus vanfongensis]|uniref:sensor histidine kinase n=1 Tax=Algoriphagus vanfongensis TaxID=426371 RepID=UPI0014715DAF|nr:GAF domain-containing sensor histidine kinase [Algoriphagus vanfongensis]